MRGDFFAFEPTLRDGALHHRRETSMATVEPTSPPVTGPGGGSRASIFLGTALANNQLVKLQDFFIGRY